MPEPNARSVSPRDRGDRLRYALIGVAGLAALTLAWLVLSWAGSLFAQRLSPETILLIVWVAAAAVLMAMGAIGLLGGHPWGASAIAWAAFGLVPVSVLGILVAIASSVMPSPYSTGNAGSGGLDPVDVIIGLTFPAALITGGLAIRLGRSLRRASAP